MSDEKIAKIRKRHEAGAPGALPIAALAQAYADRDFLLAEVERLRAGGGDMTRHRPAPLLIRLYLRASGFRGIALPWGRAYYWPWPADPGLIAHEQVHLEQLARLGPVRFTVRYLWLLLRHGYERHPMEIEAREISGHR